MTSRDFVIWLKGFTEACNDFTATPKQWDRIKEVLYEVEDYNDNPGLDEEIDDWFKDPNTFREPQNPPYKPYNPYAPPYWTGDPPGWMQFPGTTSGWSTITVPSSSGSITFTSSSGTTANTNVVWNDKMGCWHYTNYPEGFGYFTNSTLEGSTLEGKTKKQQLND